MKSAQMGIRCGSDYGVTVSPKTMPVSSILAVCHLMASHVCLERRSQSVSMVFEAGHVYLSWPAGPLVEKDCPHSTWTNWRKLFCLASNNISSEVSNTYIYRSRIYFWNKSSPYSSILRLHFQRGPGRLTEVERVTFVREFSAVGCAGHHCLPAGASTAMLGPGRIGTRGILRGLNQVSSKVLVIFWGSNILRNSSFAWK